MTAVIAVFILLSAIPAWAPIVRNHQTWPLFRPSLVLFAASAVLQLVFVGCVGAGWLLLGHSVRFAEIGIPCCMLAIVLALTSRKGAAKSIGLIVSSSLGLAVWLFFITLH